MSDSLSLPLETVAPRSPRTERDSMVVGVRLTVLKLRFWLAVVRTAIRARSYSSIPAYVRGLMATLRSAGAGHPTTRCFSPVRGAYYWSLYTPSFPSAAFERFIEGELNRIVPATLRGTLQTVFLAMTKRCGLRCEHCLEWDVLNGSETLSRTDLLTIAARFAAAGVTQIFLTGGEPLSRLADIEALVRAGDGVEYWVITSGIAFRENAAKRLATSGVRGVVFSLDHWNPASHDAFRGREGAFASVENGVRHAHEAGLVVALSLCPTRDFATRENLEHYLALASRLGAAFIQILEPRAIGHYSGRDVELTDAHRREIERFHDEVNSGVAFQSAPIICYPDLVKRRVGCLGSGRRFLYVDTDGEVHPCPFCRNAAGDAARQDVRLIIDELQARGCPTQCDPRSACATRTS